MATLIISENITVDGVIQDAADWLTRITSHDREAWAELGATEAMNAEALLMGRGTYDFLAPRWLSRTGPWAERLAALPKYVVTSNASGLTWANTVPLSGDDVPTMVAKLHREVAGELIVNGSPQLAHTLLRHHLADELRLIAFPLIAGAGTRLFDSPAPVDLHLTEARTIGENLTFTSYDIARPA